MLFAFFKSCRATQPRIVSLLSLIFSALLLSLPNCSKAEPSAPKRIVILGDSLTDGFGVSRDDAYPALLQKKLDADNRSYKVVNAGVSGDTSAGGIRRLQWQLKTPVSILVLALGANDGLRGLPPETTKENLITIIREAKERYPNCKVLLAGMLTPPSMGADYAERFKAIFPEIAAELSLPFMPFLLEGVAAEQDMNLEDGIHPNETGHQRIADEMWKYLEPLL